MRKIDEKLMFLGCMLACLLLPVQTSGQATAAPGFAVTNFATGFVNNGSIGPAGIALDASGNLFVGDIIDGFIYKFGPTGGVASAATQLNSTPFFLGSRPHGMAFGKDGHLYLNLVDIGEVVQLDPSNGTIIRTVATGMPVASALATDPLTGDLFVDQSGGGSTIFRVSNFASGPGTVVVYSTVSFADGLAFGPDGTLYAAGAGLGGVVKISGTNSATPGATAFIASVPGGLDGMAISASPNTPFLYTNNNNGTITKVDLSTNPPTLTNIVTGGSRGDFATVGPDGCLYATQTDRVLKVTNANGSCLPPPLGPLFPASPSATPVFVDIKPQSCPNPLNVGATGTLAVAILGTVGFDVTTVNPSSVKLQGVSPLRSTLEDVATPFTGGLVNANSCTTAGSDGFTDLVLFFSDQAVSAALGTVTSGEVLNLAVTGNLMPQFGGAPITGQDIVVIKK
jgi:sugar lactone lactonase YvrE